LVLRISAVRRVITAVAVFLIALSALLLPAAAQNSTFGSAVWLADHKLLKRIDLVTNQVDLTVALDHEAKALAVDPVDGAVWALVQKQLLKFDANGQPLLQADLKNLVHRLDDPRHLVLDPYDASLWVSGQKTLLHVDSQGQRLGAWTAPEVIKAMALDVDESLWLLGHRQLLHLSRQGTALHSLDLKSHVKEPDHLAVDSLGGLLWVAGKRELVRYELSHLDQPPHAVSLPSRTRGVIRVLALAVDPILGDVWVATQQDLLFIYDREANLLKTVDLGPHDLGEVQSLVFEPVSASLWLGGRKAVAHLAGNGDLEARIAVDKDAEALGAAPFRLLPTLTLLEPENGGLTNNPRPPIRLGLGASCNAVPCLLPEAYNQSLTLSVDLNGAPIGSLFTRSATEALYLSPNRLPEGLNALSAQAIDLFGHPSNRISANFIIDTIPPRFLSVTPADGTNVPQTETTISGSLDDPTATVLLLDGNGSVIAAGGAAFSFTVPLKPGTNLFTLLARDTAGNESSVVLHLMHNALTVKIINPTAGTNLNQAVALVRGTVTGTSAEIGVAVNNIPAWVQGDQFFALVPVDPGMTQLTAVVADVAANTSSDTIPVSVTLSEDAPILSLRAQPAVGTVPLTVSFSLHSPTSISSVKLDTDGDKDIDFTGVTLDGQTFQYTNPGVFVAEVTVDTNDGTTHTEFAVVQVLEPAAFDAQLQAKWRSFKEALRRGDIDGALTFIVRSQRENQRAVFEALRPLLVNIDQILTDISFVSMHGVRAEYEMRRTDDGVPLSYFVLFILDEDGIWRIKQF